MTTVAFLFPGQGSQRAGMGLDFVQNDPRSHHLYSQAEEILGWSVTDLSNESRVEDLQITLYTQPAIYVLSCAISNLMKSEGIEPACVAGHSAGEFAALTAAGAWDFSIGLKVIAERARLMHETVQPGGMAAVLGLDAASVQDVCGSYKDGLVQIANYNSPKQTVITGEKAAVEAIAPLLKEKGAKRVVPLKVSGAFHSPLMKPAQDEFRSFLGNIEINELDVPWISNNHAQPVQDSSSIRELLVKQFCEPVRWTECMKSVSQMCEYGIEIGPGEVLKGLAKACLADWTCHSTDTYVATVESMNLLRSVQ